MVMILFMHDGTMKKRPRNHFYGVAAQLLAIQAIKTAEASKVVKL
jgi:hypothetical protein